MEEGNLCVLGSRSFSRGSSQPRDGTRIVGGFFTSWATREALPPAGTPFKGRHLAEGAPSAWLFLTVVTKHLTVPLNSSESAGCVHQGVSSIPILATIGPGILLTWLHSPKSDTLVALLWGVLVPSHCSWFIQAEMTTTDHCKTPGLLRTNQVLHSFFINQGFWIKGKSWKQCNWSWAVCLPSVDKGAPHARCKIVTIKRCFCMWLWAKPLHQMSPDAFELPVRSPSTSVMFPVTLQHGVSDV